MSQPQYVLVTGGAGYIGSHTVIELCTKGYSVVVVDNLVNSSTLSLNRVRAILKDHTTPSIPNPPITFHECDLCSLPALTQIFKSYKDQGITFATCLHFAGLKAVGESMSLPLLYYQNNLTSTINLLQCMDDFECKKLVFSSSATVYGSTDIMPITEETATGVGITNPYGRSKHIIESILSDFYISKQMDPKTKGQWSITVLRYFNPVGSHVSGLIGEDPKGPPNNLMPYVSQTAVGKREFLTVFGDDYDTPDGTGVRDYIHVVDLALGHISSIEYMDKKKDESEKYFIFNLGTGIGYSVIQMVDAMKVASKRDVPYKIGARRPGDIATCYADPKKAYEEMGWKAERSLVEMCQDLWKWQEGNPNGFV